jgi:hypothetical protein
MTDIRRIDGWIHGLLRKVDIFIYSRRKYLSLCDFAVCLEFEDLASLTSLLNRPSTHVFLRVYSTLKIRSQQRYRANQHYG